MNTLYSLDQINAMAEGDTTFVTSVITAFLEEVPADLDALEQAIQSRAYQHIYQLAHKIKPNVALLGMEQAQRNALDLEILGKQSGNITSVATVFSCIN